jgi:hypothetical protein
MEISITNGGKMINRLLACAALLTTVGGPPLAGDQTVPGSGNAKAIEIAKQSPMVQSAYGFVLSQAGEIRDHQLRQETLDALGNPQTCVKHRASLTNAQKDAIVSTLVAQGLLNLSDGAGITGGAKAGVFPPVLNENTACPFLPQPFFSAPGSASVFGHHSYPGGLPIHESNNDVADVHLADGYRAVYGHVGNHGFPTLDRDELGATTRHADRDFDTFIDQDIIVGAPLWHDWAKSIVFQWNADGSEFVELNFGGTGVNDSFGGAGDSRTGAHHIITIAEAMKRGLSPAFVITMASAHSAPTNGNEYKVVNWLRAGAIIAKIDPVATGFLYKDSSGNLRLPPLRELANNTDLNAAGQTNVLAEYALHNLSDADFSYSGPAVDAVNVLLQSIAPQFGFNSGDPDYLNEFRNPVLSNFTGERLLMLYSNGGIDAVLEEVRKLRRAHKI